MEQVAQFFETFKVRLDRCLSTWWSYRCFCSLQGSWIRPLGVPSNSNDSMVLCNRTLLAFICKWRDRPGSY